MLLAPWSRSRFRKKQELELEREPKLCGSCTGSGKTKITRKLYIFNFSSSKIGSFYCPSARAGAGEGADLGAWAAWEKKSGAAKKISGSPALVTLTIKMSYTETKNTARHIHHIVFINHKAFRRVRIVQCIFNLKFILFPPLLDFYFFPKWNLIWWGGALRGRKIFRLFLCNFVKL